MPRLVHNAEIAAIFDQLAGLLEIEGANRFRVRAYRNAALEIAILPREAADMVAAGEDLAALPAIGEDLAGKIAEIVKSGRLKLLDEVTRRTPAGLSDIVALPGVGPKRAKTLHEKLGVKSLADLAAKIKAGALDGLPGFGAKTVAKIQREIEARSTRASVSSSTMRKARPSRCAPIWPAFRESNTPSSPAVTGAARRRSAISTSW